MFIHILLIMLLGLPAVSAEHAVAKHSRLWRWSAAALALASVLDASSSIGLHEDNPVLGTGQFGMRAAAIKGGLVFGSLALQYWAARKHPSLEKPASIVNFSVAAGLTGIAIHNLRVQRQSNTFNRAQSFVSKANRN